MKNYAMPLAIALVGLGLMSIGFNLNGNNATATPGVFNAGPEEPMIVWYGVTTSDSNNGSSKPFVFRAWSDGTLEAMRANAGTGSCGTITACGGWFVISWPNEGLNAAADINFDSRVNAEDLGIMLAAWGEAPWNDYPPSDCPLGLIP